MDLGDRLGMLGAILALVALGITILWPDKRWIGWVALGCALILLASWGWLEVGTELPKLQAKNPRLITPIVFLVGGCLTLALWKLITQPSGPTNPKSVESEKAKTLHDLFAGDFNNDWGFGFAPRSIVLADGTSVPFEARLLIDPTASVKFVAVFIPNSTGTYGACAGIADHIEDVGGLGLFHIQAQGGGSEQVDSGKYRFSGRVFIYHRSFLSPEQKGHLHRIYSAKNLDLELRGEEYQRFMALQREVLKKKEP